MTSWLLTLQRPGITVLEIFGGANILARSSENFFSFPKYNNLLRLPAHPFYDVISAEANAER